MMRRTKIKMKKTGRFASSLSKLQPFMPNVLLCAGLACLNQVGRLDVAEVQLDGEGIAFISLGNRKTSSLDSVVKTTHMPADCHGFGGSEPEKLLNHVDGFFPMTVRKAVLNLKKRLLFPLPRCV